MVVDRIQLFLNPHWTGDKVLQLAWEELLREIEKTRILHHHHTSTTSTQGQKTVKNSSANASYLSLKLFIYQFVVFVPGVSV